jgi:transmembrane sensor
MTGVKKNNKLFSRYADQLISHYQLQVRSDKEKVLDAVLKKIDSREHEKIRPAYNIRRLMTAGISAAAVLLILITFYFFSATVTISAGDNDIVTYRLPDASRIVLHNNSKLEFKRYFWARNVKLKGEAYFEVENGRDFHVRISTGSVEVLGTRFFVADKGKDLEVRCYQGRVKTFYNKDSWILDEGTQFTAISQAVKKEEMDIKSPYPEFAKFNGSFSNVRLTQVLSQLESFFDVQIDLQQGATRIFTGTFETGSLDSALQIVCESLQMEYRYIDQHRILVYD